MSEKAARIAAVLARFQDRDLDAHYLGYFDCFNRQFFYEAHEVLEPLWLERRRGPEAAFYKGLIQLAGAFVHLQKNRLPPAAALFRLAGENLGPYPETHHRLDVVAVRWLIQEWLDKVEAGAFRVNPLTEGAGPGKLNLRGDARASDKVLRKPL